MVLLAYQREIHIPNSVIRVEIKKEIAVAYWNVFGHGFPMRDCRQGWLLSKDSLSKTNRSFVSILADYLLI